MSIIIVRKNDRIFLINELYFMGLAFLIGIIITRVVKYVLSKRSMKDHKDTKITNPRGGGVGIKVDWSEDAELASAISVCIKDNELYLVRNKRIIELIFKLSKRKLSDQSLVLSPNLLGFMAQTMISKRDPIHVKVGEVIFSSASRSRMILRTTTSLVVGILSSAFSSVSFGMVVLIFLYANTENCWHNCDNYFEQLSRAEDGEIRIFSERNRENGQLVIAGNDDQHKVAIYIPSEKQTYTDFSKVTNTESKSKGISKSSSKNKTVTRKYNRSRKKAHMVRFTDFQKHDPVLATFEGEDEPYVPEQKCLKNPELSVESVMEHME